ncbi:translation initiation factor IF-2 subunit gamma [Candidatus Woesearchaeota archaeon RBG_13_36_6]|nr:MAG: translation initiation factor IF-2 subunit gamma [Candidatus Woesearchaeota archaeon RBG_13_36_6]
MVKESVPAQPAINIGTVGHVDHGKTTLVQALTGKWADTHSEEVKRGITIRLGYADSVFRKCPKCEGVAAYTTQEKCGEHKVNTTFLRKVSFVDAPGHESLMATMLSGATIMDGAILLIAANEECPQPQTREHLMALKISEIKDIVVVQNKIDLVSEEEALKNYNQIKGFLKGTDYENAPIIPVSAQIKVNIDALIQAIEENIPTPKRDLTKDPIMFVARSFDINKPGSDPLKIVGGVIGGAVAQGKIKEGQEVEIRPGYKVEKGGKVSWQPFTTKIVSLMTGGQKVKEVIPGGNIGLQTELDPSVVKSDQLAGSAVGDNNKLPPVWLKVKLETHLLERVVGVKDELNVEPIKLGESLMMNVNSAATIGMVTELGKSLITCNLKLPICADIGARITISRRVANRFRLIGYGVIKE